MVYVGIKLHLHITCQFTIFTPFLKYFLLKEIIVIETFIHVTHSYSKQICSLSNDDDEFGDPEVLRSVGKP